MSRSLGCSIVLGVALAVASAGSPVQAVTLKPLGFTEMVSRAALILHARVVRMESFWDDRAPLVRPDAKKVGVPPAIVSAGVNPEPPVPAGAKGGQMIFTRVTVEILEVVKGAAPGRVEFTIGGGTVGEWRAWIAGMPHFDVGGEYVLMLRERPPAGDPLVGVRQGFFPVARRDGAAVVLNADFDYVLGIENERVVARYNPQRGRLAGADRPVPLDAGLPVSDGPKLRLASSPDAQRYLASAEAPMTVDALLAAIRTRLGR